MRGWFLDLTQKVGSNRGLLVRRGYVPHRVADLMDDALLDLDLGVDGLDSFWEAAETADTSDQEVLDTSILKISQYAEPAVMSTLIVPTGTDRSALSCTRYSGL